MFFSFLDGLIHYKDPSLPQLSSLAYLYVACLFSSFLIACDFRKKKTGLAEMPEFSSVSTWAKLKSACLISADCYDRVWKYGRWYGAVVCRE